MSNHYDMEAPTFKYSCLPRADLSRCPPMPTVKQYEKPPPLGLRPRKCADEARMKEILEAMIRYVTDGKKIPNDWLLEFDELNEGLGE